MSRPKCQHCDRTAYTKDHGGLCWDHWQAFADTKYCQHEWAHFHENAPRYCAKCNSYERPGQEEG